VQSKITPYIVRTTEDLGGFIRNQRKQAGYSSLESAAKVFVVGKRFLSECERGKETAEIGKILDVIHGLGLDLAVVRRESGDIPLTQRSSASLSQKLGLDFPYDWSNPGMSEDTLIHQVLKKGRFMDILRLARHYGIDRIDAEAQVFVESSNWPRLSQIIERIYTGKRRVSG